MKNSKIKKFFPLGYNTALEIFLTICFLISGLIGTLIAYQAINHAYENLFMIVGQTKILKENVFMPTFQELIHNYMIFYILACITAVIFGIYHYLYFKKESKSIYIMKRLPSASELWRRVLTYPIIIIVIAIGLRLISFLLLKDLYLTKPPAQCIRHHQIISFFQGF